MNSKFKSEDILTVDLHNMKTAEAKKFLEMYVERAPKEVKEIVVIHGYRRGQSLLNMVRKDFKSNRVKRKFLSLNQGVTSLILAA